MRTRPLSFSSWRKWRIKEAWGINKSVISFNKRVWLIPGDTWFNQHQLPGVFSQKLLGIFPRDESSVWRLFLLWRKTSSLVWVNCVERADNSARPSGCVWTAYTVRPPLETQRTSPSPEGHYFWLWPQGQPADLPKGRGPAPQPLTGFTAYPDFTAMTTARAALVVHWKQQ